MAQQVVLHAEDISCQHCAMTIRRELQALQDVRVVDVDVAGKNVVLAYDSPQALEQARALLAEIGYPVA